MKKLLPFILSASLLLSLLAGCGKKPVDMPMPGVAVNDFSVQAQAYMEYIGTELPCRDALIPGEEPEEENRHEETVAWIISELKAAGYTDEQIACTSGEAEAIWAESGVSAYQNIVLTVAGSQPDK